MKKFFLLFIIIGSSYVIRAQVVCAGVSPVSIAGNYNFSWGDPLNTWGSPDFNIPGTYVSGDLMLVDDGSVGNSPVSGLPLANYGCAPLVNDLTGKIAVVYRYDGVTASTICWMSDKALIAQNAGAIAVLIINRPGANADITTGGGTAAPSVTIPVVLIDYNDGATLRAEMANGPVNMFLGNKTGLFANDIGIVSTDKMISKSYAVSSQLSQNGSEFNFELGTRVFNYGSSDQTNITVTANVDGPGGGSVFNATVGPISILSGDTIDVYPGEVFSFPQFSLSSYPMGKYTLTYSVSLGATDEYAGDNLDITNFVINDSLISYSELDPITNLPVAANFYRPASNTSTFSNCMVINDPNASRIGVEGIYFSSSTSYNSGILLTGEEMLLSLYRWEDVFTDLNDAGLAFDNLTQIGLGYYSYPDDLQGEVVYGSFETPVLLADNQRFLACVQTVNINIYMGSDVKTNYLWNESYYLQPMFPIENDGTFSASGFGADIPPAMGLKIFNAAEMNIAETSVLEGIAYPNPATNLVTVSLDAEGAASLTVTDVAGKVALNNKISLVNGKSEINISSLEAGIYIFNITLENGKTSQFNVVKK